MKALNEYYSDYLSDVSGVVVGRHQPDSDKPGNQKLWTAIIGTFDLYVTVDKIDCPCKTATVKYWMFNRMSEESLGTGLPRIRQMAEKVQRDHKEWKVMANQDMWWIWTEDIDFSGQTPQVVTSKSGGGW